MSAQTKAECCFHPVGQGLFYSTLITEGKKQFSIVYDCGTSSNQKYLINEIKEFIELLRIDKRRSKPVLDLLILSHLHQDHISGLVMILDHIHVKTIILPYLLLSERLLIAAQFENLNNDLAQFYETPEKWLSDKGIDNIIFASTGNFDSELAGENWNWQYEETDYQRGSRIIITPFENNYPATNDMYYKTSIDNSIIHILQHGFELNIGNKIWKFHFYFPKGKQRSFMEQ